MRRDTGLAGSVEQCTSEPGVVRVGERLMVERLVESGGVVGGTAIEEGGVAPPGPVDDLVDDHEVAGVEFGLERAARARTEDRPHAERGQRPDIGAERHPVGDIVVVAAVPGQEGNRTAGDLTDGDRCRGSAERRLELEVDRVVDEVVETRSADHAHLDAELAGPVVEGNEHQSLELLDPVELDEPFVVVPLELSLFEPPLSPPPDESEELVLLASPDCSDDVLFLALDRLSVL